MEKKINEKIIRLKIDLYITKKDTLRESVIIT